MSGVPDGPSKDAGIIQNDVILVFDGHEVEDVRDLIQTVGNTPVGKAVDVIVLRGGERLTLSVTLGLRDDENLARARPCHLYWMRLLRHRKNWHCLGLLCPTSLIICVRVWV